MARNLIEGGNSELMGAGLNAWCLGEDAGKATVIRLPIIIPGSWRS